jgi:hypothetical protein
MVCATLGRLLQCVLSLLSFDICLNVWTTLQSFADDVALRSLLLFCDRYEGFVFFI